MHHTTGDAWVRFHTLPDPGKSVQEARCDKKKLHNGNLCFVYIISKQRHLRDKRQSITFTTLVSWRREGLCALTLQFSIHGDVREASQHSHDFIVFLLPQETQHAASVRILETHQVLQASNLVLYTRGIIMYRFWTVKAQCMYTYVNTLQLPSWRCSSGGAPPQSGAAAAVVT